MLQSRNYCGQDFFEIWREGFISIKPKFEDRLEFLLAGIQFYWDMKVIKVIEELKGEHMRYRCSNCPVPTLKELINPIILKLTQEEDCIGMAHLSPFYCQ
ncbi:hypothetical protein CU097_006813 [Rhizopus azygosporus]|uniref:Uncharacterized protein n=1 Tax=Rhizopus azygosporus TaxID=86630 RepID=A0A367JIB5_RHIAZ|nr:hypothetical protein CU097_006813 [Rhizopus azygosporus]